MIFALRQPAVLLGLLVGFALGVGLRAAVQRRLVSGSSPRAGRKRLRAVGGSRPPARTTLRPRQGWGAYLDPYGTVAAVLAGAGWGTRIPPRRKGRGSDVMLLLAALLVHGALVAVGLVAYRAAGGSLALVHLFPVSEVLHGSFDPGPFGQSASLGFVMINLACGLLALLPIPPLELGVVLWGRLPRSPGARRLAYRVLEEQWGVAVVLLFLLLPLAGQQPLLLVLIDHVGESLLATL